MSIVNFAIPQTLEDQVDLVIKEKGFASRAEFFRFTAIQYIDEIKHPFPDEDARMAYLSDQISKVVREKFSGKNIASIDKQLAEL